MCVLNYKGNSQIVSTDMLVIFHCFCSTYFFWSFSWDHLLQVSIRWKNGVWAAIPSDTTLYLMTNCCSALSKLWDNTSSVTDTVIENCLMVRNLTSANDFILKDIHHHPYLTLFYFRSLVVTTKFSPRQNPNYSNLYRLSSDTSSNSPLRRRAKPQGLLINEGTVHQVKP